MSTPSICNGSYPTRSAASKSKSPKRISSAIAKCSTFPYFVDRASHFREDSAWIGARLNDPTTRLIVIYHSAVLCHEDNAALPCFLSPDRANIDLKASIFLGQVDGITYFTLSIHTEDEAHHFSRAHQATFKDYASSAPVLQFEYRDLVSLACFTNYWHSRHRKCGTCGSATTTGSAGHRRICTSTTCAQQYFPSMDPAVIMLIEHEDRCLLGRQQHWPEGMHSTLAGFVEQGECHYKLKRNEAQTNRATHFDGEDQLGW